MSIRQIVTAVAAAPPCRNFLGTIARSRTGRRLLNRLNPRRGVYDSLAEAWAAAGRRRHPGHEHPETVDRHAELAGAPLPSDYALLYWLNRIAGDLHVFDYGGNMGNVFYACARYVNTSDRQLRWTVYDLPLVLRLARERAGRRTGPVPEFADDLAAAANANVLLVSGAYHYWEKSTTDFLDQFPRLPEHVVINRAPFYEEPKTVVSIQATHTFAFPILIRPAQELVEGFARRNYEVVDRWVAAEYGHLPPLFPQHGVPAYSGFYFRRRAS